MDHFSSKTPSRVVQPTREQYGKCILLWSLAGVFLVSDLIGLAAGWSWVVNAALFLAAAGLAYQGWALWPKAVTHRGGSLTNFQDVLIGPSISAEMESVLAPLHAWSTLWAQGGGQDAPGPARQPYVGSILDAVHSQWRKILAQQCFAQWQAQPSGQANVWVDALMADFKRAARPARSLESVYAQYMVEKCYPTSLAEVLATLQAGADWPDRFFDQALAPLWTSGGHAFDLDSGLVVLEQHLAQMLSMSLPPKSPYQIYPMAWPRSGMVVFVRRVQGLPSAEAMSHPS
jgi:hypothetical protein